MGMNGEKELKFIKNEQKVIREYKEVKTEYGNTNMNVHSNYSKLHESKIEIDDDIKETPGRKFILDLLTKSAAKINSEFPENQINITNSFGEKNREIHFEKTRKKCKKKKNKDKDSEIKVDLVNRTKEKVKKEYI